MKIGPKTEALIEALKELATLLGELDEDHWAHWMAECAQRLRRSEFSGITHLLGAYGGMGSFNDAFPELVGEISEPKLKRARKLRTEVWELADKIRRAAEFAGDP